MPSGDAANIYASLPVLIDALRATRDANVNLQGEMTVSAACVHAEIRIRVLERSPAACRYLGCSANQQSALRAYLSYIA
jgi:hypothetical protein